MTRPVYRFLDFEIITARRELLRGGEVLNTEPKVYDLLLYLLERRDRAVSKDELQDEIWPNVVVTEAALTRCVMKARNVLGDVGSERQIIKTLHSHGYQFIAGVETFEGCAAQPLAGTTDDGIERVSIAVMPFANLSNDPDQEYLADGLTQDIITDLSRNSWLYVIAAGSTSTYKGRNVGMQQLVSELGARYVVEGSLRCHGDTVRISVALTDATTGAREWAERYDQPLTEFFDIQDEISQGIAASLGSHVRRAEGHRAISADSDALDVWGLLHRGIGISWSRFNRESNLEAESLYRKALDRAPGNARAMSFLANSIAMKVANGWSDDVPGDSAEAFELGEAAILDQPEDPMVVTNFGHMNTCLGKSAAAVGILERALELDPNSAWGHGMLAYALTASGRAEEAIPLVTRALRLSPRDSANHWYLVMLSWAYLQLQQFEDVAREARRSINSFAGWQVPWATLAVAQAALGQMQDAKTSAEIAAKLETRVDAEGFKRFFRFIVRNEALGKRIDSWLDETWPKERPPADDRKPTTLRSA